ncbi:ESPR-type extended signal peptide-containing protein, partial [Rhodanobacter sp. Si-c]
MNRIYRLVFNRTLGVMQVASELVATPKGAVVGGADASSKPIYKSRWLAVAVSIALVSIALPAMAQTCT